jgi:hypothetical protein
MEVEEPASRPSRWHVPVSYLAFAGTSSRFGRLFRILSQILPGRNSCFFWAGQACGFHDISLSLLTSGSLVRVCLGDLVFNYRTCYPGVYERARQRRRGDFAALAGMGGKAMISADRGERSKRRTCVSDARTVRPTQTPALGSLPPIVTGQFTQRGERQVADAKHPLRPGGPRQVLPSPKWRNRPPASTSWRTANPRGGFFRSGDGLARQSEYRLRRASG